jgi:hypothetical protein
MPQAPSPKKIKRHNQDRTETEDKNQSKPTKDSKNGISDPESSLTKQKKETKLKIKISPSTPSEDAMEEKGGDILLNKPEVKQQPGSSVDHRAELEILMDDVRGSIKDNSLKDSASQVLPGSTYHKKRDLPKPLQKIEDWFNEKFSSPYSSIGYKKKPSPIRIIIMILIMAVMIYFLFLIGRPYFQNSPTATPTYTQIPTYAIPEPFSVEFPGGWQFLLKTSRVPYPDWKPTRPEWLNGTQICKLIAIPWNIQIDAVYKTIVKGDVLTLMLDNKDQYSYIVNKLETDSKDELIQKVNNPDPCLVIFLYKENSDRWQVISSVPSSP